MDRASDPELAHLRQQLFEALLVWHMELTNIEELRSRLEAGGPVAGRATEQLRLLNGNDGERHLEEKVSQIIY